MTYEINTVVRIAEYWLDSPAEAELLFRVIEYNPATDLYEIECINSGMSLYPIQVVSADMIEKA